MDRTNDPKTPKLPKGIDRRTYEEARVTNPGGLVSVDISRVAAPGKVEKYEVPPGRAGLIRLVRAGILQILSDGTLLIKRPLGRFPPGIYQIRGLSFMLGKGIKMPKGSPGYSCVVSEETGEILYNKIREKCLYANVPANRGLRLKH